MDILSTINVLPNELVCQILHSVTDPKVISRLLTVNPRIQQLTQNCVIKIEATQSIPAELVLNLRYVETVIPTIIITTQSQLIQLAQHRSLRHANFDISLLAGRAGRAGQAGQAGRVNHLILLNTICAEFIQLKGSFTGRFKIIMETDYVVMHGHKLVINQPNIPEATPERYLTILSEFYDRYNQLNSIQHLIENSGIAEYIDISNLQTLITIRPDDLLNSDDVLQLLQTGETVSLSEFTLRNVAFVNPKMTTFVAPNITHFEIRWFFQHFPNLTTLGIGYPNYTSSNNVKQVGLFLSHLPNKITKIIVFHPDFIQTGGPILTKINNGRVTVETYETYDDYVMSVMNQS